MHRTADEIKQHYEVEKQLAARLRGADAATRKRLYPVLYDDLFKQVPLHPQLTRKQDESEAAAAVELRMRLLSRFLHPRSVFLEVGAGDCSLSRRVAERVRNCYALDVSQEILDRSGSQPNMQTVLSDGCTVPVPEGSIDVAYSYQVMEHVHPDDAMEQLHNIYRGLAPNGLYLCVTPNRLSGPHDISRYFDAVATGFHMKEYTLTELEAIFRCIGFRKTIPYVGIANYYIAAPVGLLKLIESILARLPGGVRRWLANQRGVRNLLFISLVGVK